MKDDRLLDQIRESAKKLPVPENLEPQAIEETLRAADTRKGASDPGEDSGRENKKRHRRRRYLSLAAAAVAAACFIVVGITGGPAKIKDFRHETAEAAMESEESAATDTSAEEAVDAVEDTADGTGLAQDGSGVDSYLTAAADYGEIYEKLKENYEDGMGTSEGALEWNTDTAASAEESAEAAGAEQEAVTDAQDTVLMGEDVSQTNVQVEGVDEGDIVKTDGEYLYVMDPDNGVKIIRTEDLAQLGNISWEKPGTKAYDMYLDGDSLAVVSSVTESTLQLPSSSSTRWLEGEDVEGQMENRDYLEIQVYDISNRENPVLKGSTDQDGIYLTSRKNGDYLYLMSRYYPELSSGAKEQTEKYVPRAGGELLPADCIYLPEYADGGEYSYFVVASVNLKDPEEIADRCAVVTESRDFYVSRDNIYVTGMHYGNSWVTNIVRFSYEDGQIEPEAGGSVPGMINDSFSMDEYQEHLRIVTWDSEGSTTTTGLYILDGDLQVTGQITDLAPGEALKSSRFLGDTGYFVTFEEVDPLFSVDLSDPENPRILGELKIPGFSSYLHFYGEDLLLGIGWEDNASTGSREVKLSMFDISDPANVQEKDKEVLENATYCPGTEEYKSILVMEEQNLLGMAYNCFFPLQSEGWNPAWGKKDTFEESERQRSEDYYVLYRYVKGEGFQVAFRCLLNQEEGYGNSGFYDELARVRGVIIGDRLYIVMSHGISAFHLGDTVEKTGSVVW